MSGNGYSVWTISGREFHPLAPRAEDVDIDDIAHALSHLCRYGGHVPQFYSVAQHSVLVAARCREVTQSDDVGLAGLLHDAAEAYIGDVVWPLKRSRQLRGYGVVERRVQAAVNAALGPRGGVTEEQREIVKRADVEVLLAEVRDFLGSPPWAQERVGRPGIEPWPAGAIRPVPPEDARGVFKAMWWGLAL